MTIKDMHYDFKIKINKIDSQQYSNLLVPEIDWLLREAEELFVKIIAYPRKRSYTGFEIHQRSIDDIKTLVIHNHCLDVIDNTVTLPSDYWHFINAEVIMSKGNCINVRGNLHIRQHDDLFELSPFDKSSFEWREINGVFYKDGIKLFDDGTFTNNSLCLSYIKRPRLIHNAEDFKNGSYKLPNGQLLIGTVDSELPEHTHREIVDIAVLIATQQLQIPDYQLKFSKISLNDIKQ